MVVSGAENSVTEFWRLGEGRDGIITASSGTSGLVEPASQAGAVGGRVVSRRYSSFRLAMAFYPLIHVYIFPDIFREYPCSRVSICPSP